MTARTAPAAGEWRTAALHAEIAMLREHVQRNGAAARQRRQARERKNQAFWEDQEFWKSRGRREALGGAVALLLDLDDAGPRRSLLHFLALGIDPDQVAEVEGHLVDAALPDIATATDGWSRYRRRRYERAVLAGLSPLPAATPPSAREAKAPEMHPWTAAQLAAFLGWAGRESRHVVLWTVLAMTGMRRGEALTLRWRDVDLDAATVSIRRSAGIVRYAGEGAEMVEDDTNVQQAPRHRLGRGHGRDAAGLAQAARPGGIAARPRRRADLRRHRGRAPQRRARLARLQAGRGPLPQGARR